MKTLRDLNIIKGKVHALGGEVGVDELKQVAIEWVKDKEEFIEALQNKDTLKNTKGYNWEIKILSTERAEAIIDWIKYFFNLTDEDLKE